jgi:hypothetical protein
VGDKTGLEFLPFEPGEGAAECGGNEVSRGYVEVIAFRKEKAMNKEFHYDITCLIARRAGFSRDDAFLIAYASQYTDDNTESIYINTDMPGAYTNHISQTVDLRKPEDELLEIYSVFHFLPGTAAELSSDSAHRQDDRLHPLNTIPDSANAKKVIARAFKAQNPYLIGIATHVYVDTFAHQNFVGTYDDFNSMGVALLPNIGHLDAQHSPDIPSERWIDPRLVPGHSSIDNKERFLLAAGRLFDLYSAYLGTHNDKIALLADLSNAIVDSENARKQNYCNLIGPEYVEYDKNAWFAAATSFTVTSAPGADTAPGAGSTYIWKDGHEKKDWFQFQEAVKAHRTYVLRYIVRPICSTMK